MGGWKIDADIEVDTEWSGSDDTTSNSEKSAWCINPTTHDPGATAANSFLGLGAFDAEEFRVNPEDVDLEPESIQADNNGWTIEAEPS